jgi:hypothetical protein
VLATSKTVSISLFIAACTDSCICTYLCGMIICDASNVQNSSLATAVRFAEVERVILLFTIALREQGVRDSQSQRSACAYWSTKGIIVHSSIDSQPFSSAPSSSPSSLSPSSVSESVSGSSRPTRRSFPSPLISGTLPAKAARTAAFVLVSQI